MTKLKNLPSDLSDYWMIENLHEIPINLTDVDGSKIDGRSIAFVPRDHRAYNSLVHGVLSWFVKNGGVRVYKLKAINDAVRSAIAEAELEAENES